MLILDCINNLNSLKGIHYLVVFSLVKCASYTRNVRLQQVMHALPIENINFKIHCDPQILFNHLKLRLVIYNLFFLQA